MSDEEAEEEKIMSPCEEQNEDRYEDEQCNKQLIHSRQGLEQHQIDVDLLIQKLMQISNVEMLDSLNNKQMDNMQIEQKYSIE